MNSTLLRERFLKFFEKNQHQIVSSSSLIPAQDPTLLFTNAGMNQFKDIFLGIEKRSYQTATTAQKCVRAGGKHNDLDEVGFSDRHLTFFEMLGNFSFGEYFKEEAITFAWDFLTKDIGIDEKKLSVSVHYSDEESFNLWRDKIGLSENRIRRLGDEDNFWQMGNTGPCGPCTEIFYDRGAEFDGKIIYGVPATRHLEIWNLVFMQFNQSENSQRQSLQKKGVDTGMGLERLTMALGGGDTVFDSDLFAPIFDHLQSISDINYKKSDYKMQAAFNVVADHMRSASMIIADGGVPSNDGRGYVLRKIIRRALLFFSKIYSKTSVIAEIPAIIAQIFSSHYPEISINLEKIKGIVAMEEEKFSNNLERGKKFFESLLLETTKTNSKILPGTEIFKLYDTYGFPLEVSKVLAREQNLEIDIESFEEKMEEQKKNSGKKDKDKKLNFNLPPELSNQFLGYQKTSCDGEILWMYEEGQICYLVTHQTPFFASCGGQVSDSGKVEVNGIIFSVDEVLTQHNGANNLVYIIGVNLGQKPNPFKIGQVINQTVIREIRANTAKNHTATHLLHAALQKVLGSHAKQAGSLVHPDYLRFSFNHDKPLTTEEILKVENLVNWWAQENFLIEEIYTTFEQSQKIGALALFGEKYNPEAVRVIKINDFSIELCGGTHVQATGQVGVFKILSDESLGSGVRCIVAVSGEKAVENYQQQFAITKALGQKFACPTDKINIHIEKVLENSKLLTKDLQKTRLLLLKTNLNSFEEAKFVGKFGDLICIKQQDLSEEECKFVYNELLSTSKKRIVVILQNNNNNIVFSCKIGSEISKMINLDNLLSELKQEQIKAGGKIDFIRGSCNFEKEGLLIEIIKKLIN